MSRTSVPGLPRSRETQPGLGWPLPATLTDQQLYHQLFPPMFPVSTTGRTVPDCASLHTELKRKGVTLLLLWEEYLADHPQGYRYSHFCELYRCWARKLKLTLGRISMRQAMTVLEGTLKEVPTLCSDAHGSWSAVAKAEDLPHVALNASKGQRVKDIYHIQNANAFHRCLKQWMERFNGVASKFLGNYLVWFCFLDAHSAEVLNAKRDVLLSASFMNPTHQTYKAIRSTKFALPA